MADRLFVAIWPPPAVVAALDALPRPVQDGVRWMVADQWHVTLRFLGRVDVDEAGQALDSVRASAVDAVVGPAVEVVGPRILAVPVAGLGTLAAAVEAATASVGDPPPARPFHGHLTVARAKGVSRSALRRIAGAPIEGDWPVTEVALVRSHLASDRARYEIVRIRTLTS